LVIGVAIVAVVLAMAVPSFRSWSVNTQIRNATESMLNGLQLARSEAIRCNINVEFQLVGTDSSWTVTRSAVCPNAPNPGLTVQSRQGLEGSRSVSLVVAPGQVFPAGATKLTYGPLGRIVANADASATITRLDIGVPPAVLATASTTPMRILLARSQIRMCDPKVTIATDSRFC
jgi:type IV fimbrial biogenesis protein FimT